MSWRVKRSSPWATPSVRFLSSSICQDMLKENYRAAFPQVSSRPRTDSAALPARPTGVASRGGPAADAVGVGRSLRTRVWDVYPRPQSGASGVDRT